jgi:hypothetical protein
LPSETAAFEKEIGHNFLGSRFYWAFNDYYLGNSLIKPVLSPAQESGRQLSTTYKQVQ